MVFATRSADSGFENQDMPFLNVLCTCSGSACLVLACRQVTLLLAASQFAFSGSFVSVWLEDFDPMSTSRVNETSATQREGLADAIHELLSQPDSFLSRTDDPQQPHSVQELPDGTTVYTLPGARSNSPSASVHLTSTMPSSTRCLLISFRRPTWLSINCRIEYRPWRKRSRPSNRAALEQI